MNLKDLEKVIKLVEKANINQLKLEEDGDYWIAHFNHKKLPFLKEDVVILPLTNITIEELSEKYSDRHGFIIQSSFPFEDNYLLEINKLLVQHRIVNQKLEFITRLGNNIVAFVYEEVRTEPLFFTQGSFTTVKGIFLVEALSLYIKLTSNPFRGSEFNLEDFVDDTDS